MIENYLHIISIVAETLISGGGLLAVVSLLVEHSKKNNHKPVTWLLDKAGHMMTRGVMEEVKTLNGEMEERIKGDIKEIESALNVRIDEVVHQVEKNKADDVKQHEFGKADRLHDDILLQADKMRLAGKFPSEERARVLYQKVLSYRAIVDKYEGEYQNGVCELACEYIENWFKKNYASGEI